MFDVIIVGAGPAGLSAALMLGRCCRHVLLCDSGEPRNAPSRAIHGFLTRDGTSPAEFLQIGRAQLQRYPNVEYQALEVIDVVREEAGFTVTLEDQSRITSRTLLLATGVVDERPALPSLEALYGTSVFTCPYCDGWEVRDQPLAIYGTATQAFSRALNLLHWSRDLVVCIDGPNTLDQQQKSLLASHEIGLVDEPIARLEGRDGQLERIVFANGDVLARRALFFHSRVRPRSHLAEKLGYDLRSRQVPSSVIPGLYLAGDLAYSGLVSEAVAFGTGVAIEIYKTLHGQELKQWNETTQGGFPLAAEVMGN